MSPESTTLGIVDIPANRLEIWIAGIVVACIELDTVTIRVANIQKECITYPVTAWTALDGFAVACCGKNITQMYDTLHVADPETEMVQARTCAFHYRHIMHAWLAVEPTCP